MIKQKMYVQRLKKLVESTKLICKHCPVILYSQSMSLGCGISSPECEMCRDFINLPKAKTKSCPCTILGDVAAPHRARQALARYAAGCHKWQKE